MEKKVDALAEGQWGVNEKFAGLDQLAEDEDGLKIRVTALEAVVEDHAAQIQELRMAR